MKTQSGEHPPSDWRAVMRGGGVVRLLPPLALLVFGGLFMRHVTGLDGAAIWQALAGLAPWQWVCALIFTAASFRAIGQYDVIIHRILGTRQTSRTARSAGMKAIALSQTIGFGAVTSALVRWRCLPELAPAQVLRVSVMVSLSFLAALAAVTAIVVPWSGVLPNHSGVFALGAGAVVALLVLARLAHRLGFTPNKISHRAILELLVATAADTCFAALALWVLWPDAIAFQTLFAAYLLALGAGLLSNAPGGLGAFDLTLLALLGVTQNEESMAAVIAFRAIYYGVPAGVALLGVVSIRRALSIRPLIHPERALIGQTAIPFNHVKGALLTLPCWGVGAILGDLPAGMTTKDLRRQTDPRAIYKCSPGQAAAARQNGWAVLRCAQDAILNPQIWTPEGPARRQLRRALAQFDRSGLTITQVADPSILAPVAKDWAANHGGERGHSMGRYCPTYLSHQIVFAAFDGDTPVAFVSFHTGKTWTLDLMRHKSEAPNGVMHALVNAGIEAAGNHGVTRMSLASVAHPDPQFPFANRIVGASAGLRRFKQAFSPDWEPRYVCATNPARLWATMITLAAQIRWPYALANPNSAQRQHEDFSFAPAPHPCEPLEPYCGDPRHDEHPIRTAHHA